MSKTQPVLKGPSIQLRPLVKADAAAMFASLEDQEVARLTGTHDEFTFDAVEQFCGKSASEPDRYDYVICRPEQPEVALGEVVLNDIDLINRSANFRGALYSEHDFSQGIGTEAIRLLLAFGFDELNLNRIELEVYDFNLRAIHVYEKLGFSHEGRKRQALCWQGQYHDALVMGLLAQQWKTR